MVFDELVVHNFGVYQGRQVIPLTPPSSEQPIVLFGGVNGAGKTTLLDALHLALYGKRAHLSNRDKQPYHDFLRQCIHRHTPPREGAAVELEFRHHSEGREVKVRVLRSWSEAGAGLREHLEVLVDDKYDPFVTECWDERVEDFIPLGISPLFFFDGEKIENLAKGVQSSELIESAIRSLLGLDLVDQLGSDLVVLMRRKRAELKSTEEQEAIRGLQAEVERVTAELDRADLLKGALQNEVDGAERALSAAKQEFQRVGGELWERREVLAARLKELEQSVTQADEALRELAAGSAPLLLVRDLLTRVAKSAEREGEIQDAKVLHRALVIRDKRVVDWLANRKVGRDLPASLEAFLADDREHQKQMASQPTVLDLSPEGHSTLVTLLGSGLESTAKRLSIAVGNEARIRRQLRSIESQLAAVPDQDVVAVAAEALRASTDRWNLARARLEAQGEARLHLEKNLETAKARLAKALGEMLEQDIKQQDALRIVTNLERVRGTLVRFRQEVLRKHIHRIEFLVFDSFRHLMRKNTLVASLSIDPSDFRLILQTRSGHEVPPDRLSAGERQLLAVSLLWGLARASGRPLPTVIDTPLGRLDEAHRRHVVERYLPQASHQVIVFSTDKEIDRPFLDILLPSIGHAYKLEHDDGLQATRVVPGYFWTEVA